jgi:hypothetical protein
MKGREKSKKEGNKQFSSSGIKLFTPRNLHMQMMLFCLLLSLAPQPSLGLGLLLKIQLNFLEASQQFSFLEGRVVSSTPNPHPGGPGLCIYIPQR